MSIKIFSTLHILILFIILSISPMRILAQDIDFSSTGQTVEVIMPEAIAVNNSNLVYTTEVNNEMTSLGFSFSQWGLEYSTTANFLGMPGKTTSYGTANWGNTFSACNALVNFWCALTDFNYYNPTFSIGAGTENLAEGDAYPRIQSIYYLTPNTTAIKYAPPKVNYPVHPRPRVLRRE